MEERHGYVKNPLLDWPRRRPCFCGSKGLFKNCHEGRLKQWVPAGEFADKVWARVLEEQRLVGPSLTLVKND